jgi:hypothetical protein
MCDAAFNNPDNKLTKSARLRQGCFGLMRTVARLLRNVVDCFGSVAEVFMYGAKRHTSIPPRGKERRSQGRLTENWNKIGVCVRVLLVLKLVLKPLLRLPALHYGLRPRHHESEQGKVPLTVVFAVFVTVLESPCLAIFQKGFSNLGPQVRVAPRHSTKVQPRGKARGNSSTRTGLRSSDKEIGTMSPSLFHRPESRCTGRAYALDDAFTTPLRRLQ